MTCLRSRNGAGAPWIDGQVVEVIVDRLELAVGGVAQQRVKALLRFAREQADADVERGLQVGLHAVEHREAARDMEAADHHRHAGGAQRPGDVERARKLVRLHADQADQAEPAVAGKLANDLFRPDACVGLVDRRDVDRDVGPKHLTLRRIHG